ncbi:MAG: hypothetical protein SW833_22265 [Cyanobacteriota bacterium]|nr:hypothetical protein [Cyanobacteriota bacterium]
MVIFQRILVVVPPTDKGRHSYCSDCLECLGGKEVAIAFIIHAFPGTSPVKMY